MMAALWVGFVAFVLAVAVVIAVVITNERNLADDCYSRGGIPVQGDETVGNPVVCLDPSVVLK